MAKPLLRATEEAGRSLDDPTWEELHDLLAGLHGCHRFVIYERLDREPVDQHYTQAYLNDDLSYQVEYREGSADKHFEAHVPRPLEVIGVEPIANVMFDWAHDRPGWREALPWTPMSW